MNTAVLGKIYKFILNFGILALILIVSETSLSGGTNKPWLDLQILRDPNSKPSPRWLNSCEDNRFSRWGPLSPLKAIPERCTEFKEDKSEHS